MINLFFFQAKRNNHSASVVHVHITGPVVSREDDDDRRQRNLVQHEQQENFMYSCPLLSFLIANFNFFSAFLWHFFSALLRYEVVEQPAPWGASSQLAEKRKITHSARPPLNAGMDPVELANLPQLEAFNCSLAKIRNNLQQFALQSLIAEHRKVGHTFLSRFPRHI